MAQTVSPISKPLRRRGLWADQVTALGASFVKSWRRPPRPLPGQSWFGRVLATAACNHLEVREAALVAVTKFHIRPARFRAVKVDWASYRGQGSVLTEWGSGLVRYCPVCAQGGYLPLDYDEESLTHCPLHVVKLRTDCDWCGRPCNEPLVAGPAPYLCTACGRHWCGGPVDLDDGLTGNKLIRATRRFVARLAESRREFLFDGALPLRSDMHLVARIGRLNAGWPPNDLVGSKARVREFCFRERLDARDPIEVERAQLRGVVDRLVEDVYEVLSERDRGQIDVVDRELARMPHDAVELPLRSLVIGIARWKLGLPEMAEAILGRASRFDAFEVRGPMHPDSWRAALLVLLYVECERAQRELCVGGWVPTVRLVARNNQRFVWAGRHRELDRVADTSAAPATGFVDSLFDVRLHRLRIAMEKSQASRGDPFRGPSSSRPAA